VIADLNASSILIGSTILIDDFFGNIDTSRKRIGARVEYAD
jgi:hypothetical protein